jgi:hypothetical protein
LTLQKLDGNVIDHFPFWARDMSHFLEQISGCDGLFQLKSNVLVLDGGHGLYVRTAEKRELLE